MGTWSLGSIAGEVHNLVPNIPISISGTTLKQIADRKREYVANYTGETIGSNSIDIKYQGIIVNLTAAEVCDSMLLVGVDAANVHLGDFSISKGAGSNLEVASQKFEEKAEKELNSLGRKINYYQALG